MSIFGKAYGDKMELKRYIYRLENILNIFDEDWSIDMYNTKKRYNPIKIDDKVIYFQDRNISILNELLKFIAYAEDGYKFTNECKAIDNLNECLSWSLFFLSSIPKNIDGIKINIRTYLLVLNEFKTIINNCFKYRKITILKFNKLKLFIDRLINHMESEARKIQNKIDYVSGF